MKHVLRNFLSVDLPGMLFFWCSSVCASLPTFFCYSRKMNSCLFEEIGDPSAHLYKLSFLSFPRNEFNHWTRIFPAPTLSHSVGWAWSCVLRHHFFSCSMYSPKNVFTFKSTSFTVDSQVKREYWPFRCSNTNIYWTLQLIWCLLFIYNCNFSLSLLILLKYVKAIARVQANSCKYPYKYKYNCVYQKLWSVD